MTSNSMRLADTNSGGLFHIFTDRKGIPNNNRYDLRGLIV